MNTIEEAIEDFREGKFLIVVDDEDRENEGDFIIAAEKITPEKVNFMLTNGRGVLCAPITEERCEELELNMQVIHNTSMLETPFTVTVDKLGGGCTTGVSIYDRAQTILALADPATKPSDLGRPGHINPLRARSRGVLRRAGHTEATVDMARLAGLYPAGALIEILNEDGTMARMPQLIEVSKKFGIKIITIRDLIADRLRTARREGGRGRPANRARTFPHHSFPPEKQRGGTCGTDQRRTERRRGGARPRPLVVHDRRYLRFDAMRLRRTTAQGYAPHRAGR